MFKKKSFIKRISLFGVGVIFSSFLNCSELNDDYIKKPDNNCTASECHISVPSLNQYPPKSGFHREHLESSLLNMTCNTCHDNYSTNDLHKNGNLDSLEIVLFKNELSGNYDVSNNCSNLSCHGDVNWYESFGLECDDCHGYSDIYLNPENQGKHLKHLESSLLNMDCNICHENYSTNDLHKNGTFDSLEIVLFNNEFSGNYDNSDNCSNLSCHGDANWYEDSKLSCNSCHGESSIYPNPKNQGKHSKHINKKSILCEDCHQNYSESETHLDGKTDTENDGEVNIISIPFDNNLEWDDSNNSCSKIGSYKGCHGGKKPKFWD